MGANVIAFANAIRDANLPKGEEVLSILGEGWERDVYPINKRNLLNMAYYYERDDNLHRTFVDGFCWMLTKQGHEWWMDNVYSELKRKGL